jgi:subtilisin-like proprotein convertase family protein
VKHGIRRGEWKLSVAEVAGQEGKLNVWSLEIEPA